MTGKRGSLLALALLLGAPVCGAAPLETLKDRLAARNTRALLVARHGAIVYEWYAPGSGPEQRHGSASLAKALVGGVSLWLATRDGRVSPDDLASKYISAWRDDPWKSRITLRHLATHSSGIEDAEEHGKPHGELTGWKGDFWKRTPDPFSIALQRAPVLFEPGTRYHYSNPGMAALAYAVTASLRGAPQADIRALLKARVMDPLGVPESEWSIGYGKAYALDGLELYANWGGGAFTPRAVARVAEWIMREAGPALAYAGMPLPDRSGGHPAPASGLGFYTNFDGVWSRLPRDAFAGAGAGHQLLLGVPSLGLVVVRNGGDLRGAQTRDRFWAPLVEQLFDPLMDALFADPPYPRSGVIRGVEFAPVSSVVCKAVDSDNWPLTWADDGEIFASYGDGWGFDPRTEKKLSQGFARISGPPEAFEGENVRSETGETLGDGAKGAKASGMLMVEGVLYMWVRNTGNSQIAWSEDRGRSWRWGFRFDAGFGSPAFLNFGRNYAGARDGFVYLYSQDGPSAYESDDRVALARVPRERIREREAYEFFVRRDGEGRPVWSRDIAERGAVLEFAGRCRRVDAVYDAALKRYLLALGYDHSGGWGLFDAPEPWGPWTTAFHTDHWGLGATHGYRLPSKWISRDGRTLWLVFSGVRPYDAFCARRMKLQ